MATLDSFIDDEDDSCPLCVEEFDLSDKNFRPCPCGYQVCQFCFNNIKTNMNGLCPACRRPYDEKTIQFKVVTPEDYAKFKAEVQRTAKKKAVERQKEAQKREVESLNRKHLSGLRVVQKNLVYVIGLNPAIQNDDLLQTLRGDKYFGQYGKIIKIVVSKAKHSDSAQGQSLGVYVTFVSKDDASRCITAVNGSMNGDRVLRAQLGTTKYCSAYLRGEQCTNKQCMFLHEPGENEDSYSRQELSSINGVSTQRPLAASSSASSSTSRRGPAQATIQQVQPLAAATHPLARESSKDGSDCGDASALPSSANWGNRILEVDRRGSHATGSTSMSSPALSQVLPATADKGEEALGLSQGTIIEASGSTKQFQSSNAPAQITEDVSVLYNLLKAINLPALTFTKEPIVGAEIEAFPPLFDENGGEKRRVMRERQEVVEPQIEEEPTPDTQSVTEQLDEEEPESGSLQLGGEPEENSSRDANQPAGFSRRTSLQMPIQRTANGGASGPASGQNYSQLGNLTSINGRTLTPQQQAQLLALKSGQSSASFMDQITTGLSSSMGQFPLSGHNRQSSRYNFANENVSSIKPAHTSKMIPQQPSMLPNASQAQQGGQYYSSMPGPPPGLKSTGTPPIGAMLGQGHTFGGSFSNNSAFGGASKDNDHILRDMIRARNTAGSSQSHEAGKREYMFPCFLQQYPSASSTPAPASGLASLYGPHAGALHDFGPKQKKKGKKHRHANTSSLGGGGLVDLADPSILQARIQHQQQSNAGIGQGLFGGQAQDDLTQHDLEDASFSVDELVFDSNNDNFESHGVFRSFQSSRVATPSVPPGLGLPHAPPPFSVREESTMKPASRIVPTFTPFTPLRSVNPLLHTRTSTSSPLTADSTPLSASNLAISELIKPPNKSKSEVQSTSAESGLSNIIAAKSTYPSDMLQAGEFPALQTDKSKSPAMPATPRAYAKSSMPPAVPVSKSVSRKSSVQAPKVTPKIGQKQSESSENVKSYGKEHFGPSSNPSGYAKPIVATAAAAFPPLPPMTTTTPLMQPLPRITPKTLRLVPISKTEQAQTGGATSSSTTSLNAVTCRQPSIVSASRMDRPGTPTSEIISDNASITSASMSRANSPPLPKIGSAPIRVTTKSMQKKQRREAHRDKQKTDTGPVIVKEEPEVQIGPIMGRKKKQKKEKPPSSTTRPSSPIISRPESPSPLDAHDEENQRKDVYDVTLSGIVAPDDAAEEEKPNFNSNSKEKTLVKPEQSIMPGIVPIVFNIGEPPMEKPIPTPATIFYELHESGAIPPPDRLQLLRPPVSRDNVDVSTPLSQPNQKLTVTSDDVDMLSSGVPVHKLIDGYRLMLTSNGDCVRNLTADEEERYLELQASIASSVGHASFSSAKHTSTHGFTLIGGRAVPNGPPPYFPSPENFYNTAPDPFSKLNRDEALSYINQYVLPSLSTNPQMERALHANAHMEPGTLPGQALNPSLSPDISTWASWTVHSQTQISEESAGYVTNGQSTGAVAPQVPEIGGPFADPYADPYMADAYGADWRDLGEVRDGGEPRDSGDARERTHQPVGSVSLLSVADAEKAMQAARKETEALEKKLIALVKRNKKMLLGSSN